MVHRNLGSQEHSGQQLPKSSASLLDYCLKVEVVSNSGSAKQIPKESASSYVLSEGEFFQFTFRGGSFVRSKSPNLSLLNFSSSSPKGGFLEKYGENYSNVSLDFSKEVGRKEFADPNSFYSIFSNIGSPSITSQQLSLKQQGQLVPNPIYSFEAPFPGSLQDIEDSEYSVLVSRYFPNTTLSEIRAAGTFSFNVEEPSRRIKFSGTFIEPNALKGILKLKNPDYTIYYEGEHIFRIFEHNGGALMVSRFEDAINPALHKKACFGFYIENLPDPSSPGASSVIRAKIFAELDRLGLPRPEQQDLAIAWNTSSQQCHRLLMNYECVVGLDNTISITPKTPVRAVGLMVPDSDLAMQNPNRDVFGSYTYRVNSLGSLENPLENKVTSLNEIYFCAGLQGSGGPTSAGNDSRLPLAFSLAQNSPNPVHGKTRIRYALPQDGQVSLKVYNSLGEEVATVAGGWQEKGSYSALFDASGLASGVYIYSLSFSDGSKTVRDSKKMVVQK